MTTPTRLRNVGLPFAGIGALMAAGSLLVDGSYWLLVTGSAFLLVGLVTALLGMVIDRS